MLDYRLYFMTPKGHIMQFEPIVASNDLDAIVLAKGQSRGPMELYDKGRQVWKFAATA